MVFFNTVVRGLIIQDFIQRYEQYTPYDIKEAPRNATPWEIKTRFIGFLNKSISKNSNYRKSFYWLHAEYGARAMNALVDNNIEKCREELKNAYEQGAMPEWLLEYSRNILKSCDSDAIVFTSGDLQFNSILYLQLIENYRNDITPVPLVFIGRPNVVKLFK